MAKAPKTEKSRQTRGTRRAFLLNILPPNGKSRTGSRSRRLTPVNRINKHRGEMPEGCAKGQNRGRNRGQSSAKRTHALRRSSASGAGMRGKSLPLRANGIFNAGVL